jgi:chorismate dehydratase
MRIGCVSYINAKPLIEGLDDRDNPRVRFDVPSRLLQDLETGDVDIALCPVVDYFRSGTPLEIVPVGGIGSAGRTLTVRLFSMIPFEHVTDVYADTDSHTSVQLMRLLLIRLHGVRARVIDYHAREHVAGARLVADPPTMLLIGDKVVTDAPDPDRYPHQLDLGEAWHQMTGLPFVFAVWMCRRGAVLGDLPRLLDEQRLLNGTRLSAIADRYASRHGWPADLARTYLGRLLRYQVGPPELAAIEQFGGMLHEEGLLPEHRALQVRL